MPTDEAAPGLRALAADLRRKNASVFTTEHAGHTAAALPALAPDHAGRRRGLPDPELLRAGHRGSPDIAAPTWIVPRHLQKVTQHAMTEHGRHAIAADHVFDGDVVREHTAVIVRWRAHRRPGADAGAAADHPGAHAAGRRLAGSRIHRPAGERRRRRAVQRSADRGGNARDRGGASPVRHHRPVADADQRQCGQDAPRTRRDRRRRRPRAGHPRDPPRGAVPVARQAGRARAAPSAAAVRRGPRAARRPARRRDAGDARARGGAAGLHRAAGARPACAYRSGIRWRPTRRPKPPWRKD